MQDIHSGRVIKKSVPKFALLISDYTAGGGDGEEQGEQYHAWNVNFCMLMKWIGELSCKRMGGNTDNNLAVLLQH